MKAGFTRGFRPFVLIGLLLLMGQTAVAQGIQVRLGVNGMV